MKIVITGIIFVIMVIIAFVIVSESNPSMLVQITTVMDFFQNSQTDNMTKSETTAKNNTTQTIQRFATCDQLRKDLKDLNREQAKLANLNDHYGLQKAIKEKNELVEMIGKYCK